MSHRAHMLVGVLLAASTLASCRSSNLAGAILRIEEGNYDTAVTLLQKEIAESPDNADAHFYLGLAYGYLDEVALSYASLMTSLRLDANNTRRQRDIEDCIRHNFAKHFNKARALFGQGDYSGATAEYVLATEADPRDAAGFYNLGVALAKIGDAHADEAVTAFEKVIEIAPADDDRAADALAAGARVLAASGELVEAADWLQRLTAARPERYGVVEDVAHEFLDRHEWRSALVFLEIAAGARAAAGAEDFEVYFNMGVAWFNQRDTDPAAATRALDAWGKALAIRPGDTEALLNVTAAHVFLSEWTDAIYYGEKYAASQPRDARVWRILARCYSETGQVEKARACLARAERLQRGEP
jgi:tetratricopeptide (TPR) repeat protein